MELRIRMDSFRNRKSGEDPNAKSIEIGPVTIWFSYTTPVAFHVDGERRVVRENSWGPTTGAHLNEIDGGRSDARAARVSGVEFERLLAERVGRFFHPRDLDKDCPPEVVSDWLRDRDMHRAADAVVDHEVPKRKKR